MTKGDAEYLKGLSDEALEQERREVSDRIDEEELWLEAVVEEIRRRTPTVVKHVE